MLSTYASRFKTFNPSLAMVLKTQSICWWGDDISGEISPFRPNQSVCLNYHWLEADASTFLQKQEKTAADFQAIIKVLLRTAFEIVLSKEGKYTPDLYYCIVSYCKYYPQYADKLWALLHCYLNPKTANEENTVQIRQISTVLVQQIAKEFG